MTIKHPLEMISPEGEVYEWETVDGKVVPVIQRGTATREPGDDEGLYDKDGFAYEVQS